MIETMKDLIRKPVEDGQVPVTEHEQMRILFGRVLKDKERKVVFSEEIRLAPIGEEYPRYGIDSKEEVPAGQRIVEIWVNYRELDDYSKAHHLVLKFTPDGVFTGFEAFSSH